MRIPTANDNQPEVDWVILVFTAVAALVLFYVVYVHLGDLQTMAGVFPTNPTSAQYEAMRLDGIPDKFVQAKN